MSALILDKKPPSPNPFAAGEETARTTTEGVAAKNEAAISSTTLAGTLHNASSAAPLLEGRYGGKPTSEPGSSSGRAAAGDLFDWVADSHKVANLSTGGPPAPTTTPAPTPKPASAPSATVTPKPRITPTPAPAATPAPAVASSIPAVQAAQKTPEEQTAEAVKQSEDQLTKHGIFDSVTPAEAVAAMNTLKGLSADQQGQAIEKMSPEKFSKLLNKVPESQREQFKTLVDNTQDPERKLRLFAEYHKSKAGNDANKDKEKTKDEGHWYSRSDEQKQNLRKNDARDDIVKSTKEEIDAEIPFLLEKVKAGKLSPDEIQKYMANKDLEHADEMKTLQNHIGTMEGLADEDRVKYTTNRVEQKLKSGPFNPVTDDEARVALKTTNTLPPNLQGKLVESLDQGAFERFLDNVPKSEQKQYDTLVKNTHDPERKLKLWQGYDKAKVNSDADRAKQKTQDEGHWYSQSDTQTENKRQNNRRDEIVTSTNSEIDDETSFLLKKKQAGGLTEADVDALIKRKDHEHDIEMKYNVNLVNDTETRKNGSKVFWSDQELNDVESGLGRMPEAYVKGNKLLKEIRRSGIDTKSGKDDPTVGGDHNGGKIRLYDAGVSSGFRHTGETDRVADHNRGHVSPRGPVTPVEEAIVHEIGHDVEDIVRGQKSDAVDRFYAAAGWNQFDKGQITEQLIASGKTQTEADVEVARLDADRQKSYFYRTPSNQGNTVFEIDPYSQKYLSFDNRAMPNTAHFGYARSNPQDHWAEFYSSAVHGPTQLYQDMVADPQAQVATETHSVTMAQAVLAAATTPGDRAAAQALLAQAQQRLTDAQAAQTSRQTQWNIMRNEIFHSDTATAHATAGLKGLATSPARQQRLATFQSAAQQAATPAQIEKLRAQAEADIRVLP